MQHTLISFKTVTLRFYVYLVSEKVNKGQEVNDQFEALAGLAPEIGTLFVHLQAVA